MGLNAIWLIRLESCNLQHSTTRTPTSGLALWIFGFPLEQAFPAWPMQAKGFSSSLISKPKNIINGKIWIQKDATEEGIATDLENLGVPKDKIVLAFHSPTLRKYGEYAFA